MRRRDDGDRAGLYITVIFHLGVLIVLLIGQIGAAIAKGDTFVVDFSKTETPIEKKEAREEMEEAKTLREDVAERINQMLAAANVAPVKNVAVDRSSLKDDRNTDAAELYKEADRLAKELKDGFKVEENDDDYAQVSKTEKQEPRTSSREESYAGPSVVSYELEGRKASRLSIPAYRCLGAGYVTVIITVNPQGNVVNAKIQDDVSSNDKCLRDFAVRAARLSRFSASATAPARQVGNIVYMFVAQ